MTLLPFATTMSRLSLSSLFKQSELRVDTIGAETTATAIASTLFYLSRHPDCCSQLSDTLHNVFASSEEIGLGSKLTQCEYIWACVDEAMRLSPSVVAILWREVCGDGFVIDGEPIPAGCDLGFSTYCPHHDESVFTEPFAYKPERWLATINNDEDRERLARQRLAFNPFGLGTRKCIGLNMAYSEIVLCLAKILWHFQLRRPDSGLDAVGAGTKGAAGGRGRESEFQLYEHVTCRHDGPWLQWAWREDGQIF